MHSMFIRGARENNLQDVSLDNRRAASRLRAEDASPDGSGLGVVYMDLAIELGPRRP